MRLRLRLLFVSCALVVSGMALSALPTLAHWDYYAYMTGPEMIPPTSSPGIGGFHGKFPGHTQCPDVSGPLLIDMYVQNLVGVPTAASLWFGERGAVGQFFARLPLDATSILFTQDECWLLEVKMYVVIETDLNPEGEIRGQIRLEISAPVEPRSWGMIKHAYR